MLVGDAALAKAASDSLLTDHGIYVQSINYPTVAVGEERLRITPTPGHTAAQLDHLVGAINSVFETLSIKRTSHWTAIGGRAGVGMHVNKEAPVWSDKQLGLEDGTAPMMLAEGQKMPLGKEAVMVAESRLAELIGQAKTKIPAGVVLVEAKKAVAPIVSFKMGEGFGSKKAAATAKKIHHQAPIDAFEPAFATSSASATRA